MFNSDELNLIPIESVLSMLSLEKKGKDFLCPNGHRSPQKLQIYKNKNICKCFNCGEVSGGPINIVMQLERKSFKEACAILADNFGVGRVDNNYNRPKDKISKRSTQKIEYQAFDTNRDFFWVSNLETYIEKYDTLKDSQKLKLIYTTLYRFSLATDQKAKVGFYLNERGIKPNKAINKIGYIGQNDMAEIVEKLLGTFLMEDLINYKVFREDESFVFSGINKGGVLIVPSFDLYSDMVTGLMARPTHPPIWMSDKGIKELQISRTDIIKPLPFGFTHEMLQSKKSVVITEGHIDVLSLPGICESVYGIASPGTHGIDETILKMLSGREIFIGFDQDIAGLKASYGYIKTIKEDIILDSNKNIPKDKNNVFYKGLKLKLQEAGIRCKVLRWNTKFGSDINEVLINGNISEIEKLIR